ncbi:MAG: hypothetical protein NUV98_05510, partial [Candidatus Roizmanbacteria bacterium]|nr:hypothetical protein [Candidatus Roizmanbacteria bacterium]
MLTKRIDFIFYRILAVISLVTFSSLVYTFYQQDEWMAHGHYYVEGLMGFTSRYSAIGLIAGGGRPIARLFQYAVFTQYPYNVGLISIFAITFHLLNSILVYQIGYSLSKHRLISLVSALFFLTASSAHQAVTWVGSSISTVPSAFFALISVWYYLSFLKKERRRDLAISFICLFISYFFKQTSIFLFLFYPLVYIIKSRINLVSVKKSITVHLVLFIFLLLVIVPTFLELFVREQTSENIAASANPAVSLVHHTFFYPINSLSQMYFFPGAMFSIAKMFASDMTPLQIQTVGAKTTSSIFSSVLLVLVALAYKRSTVLRKPIV